MRYYIQIDSAGQALRYQGRGKGFALAAPGSGEIYLSRYSATTALGAIKRAKVFAEGGKYEGCVPYIADFESGERVRLPRTTPVQSYRDRLEAEAQAAHEIRLAEWRADQRKRFL
jgi:hypothetical protein